MKNKTIVKMAYRSIHATDGDLAGTIIEVAHVDLIEGPGVDAVTFRYDPEYYYGASAGDSYKLACKINFIECEDSGLSDLSNWMDHMGYYQVAVRYENAHEAVTALIGKEYGKDINVDDQMLQGVIHDIDVRLMSKGQFEHNGQKFQIAGLEVASH